MWVKELLKQPVAWLRQDSRTNIVVSSRIRLARNLKDHPFPGWGGDDGCEQTWAMLKTALNQASELQPAYCCRMNELEGMEKQILFERHLISREQLEKGAGSGLVMRRDERVAVMINEEDHLRIQAFSSGFDIRRTWEYIDRVDSEIEKHVQYAFSSVIGYLTACPSNVGTGMRASVMLHLPGLALLNEIDPIIKGVGKIGLAVRGLWGEGSEASGNLFQISNQITLGEKESDIIGNLERIVHELVEHENDARGRLFEKKDHVLQDRVGRSYGILKHAHILTSKEVLDRLSGLWLGIDMGLIKNVDDRCIYELLLLSQPAHLQMLEGKKLKPDERDEMRASMVRRVLKNATPGK